MILTCVRYSDSTGACSVNVRDTHRCDIEYKLTRDTFQHEARREIRGSWPLFVTHRVQRYLE